MMEWLRWYHGAVSDPKWPLVARRAGVSVGVVVSVWAALLEHASQDEERGSVADFDGLTFDVLYGYADGTCAAVCEAMVCRGVIVEGCLAAWGKRQVRDEGAAARKRLQRDRERAGQNPAMAAQAQAQAQAQDVAGPVTAPVTVPVTPVTPPVTAGHTEQIRADKIPEGTKTPPHPPRGGRAVRAARGAREEAGAPASAPASAPCSAQGSVQDATPGNSLPDLRAAMAAFTTDATLRETLEEYRVMRERIRKPMTGKGLALVLRELKRLGKDEAARLGGEPTALMVRLVEQSIAHSWQGVFPLKQAADRTGSVPLEASTAYPPDNHPYPTLDEIRARVAHMYTRAE